MAVSPCRRSPLLRRLLPSNLPPMAALASVAAPATLALLIAAGTAAAQAPGETPPQPAPRRFPAAGHVFTAADFERTHEIRYWQDQGTEISYLLRVNERLPVYRLRLVPDLPGDESSYVPELHHVGRVEVSLEGSPRILQTIEAESHMGARDFTAFFTIRDMNFDGYADLGIYRDGGATWASHTYWLFDPASGRFVRNDLSRDLDQLGSNGVHPNPAARTIMAPHLMYGCPLPVYDLFKIDNGRLVLVERHERLVGKEPPGYCEVQISRRVGGAMKQVEVQKQALDTH